MSEADLSPTNPVSPDAQTDGDDPQEGARTRSKSSAGTFVGLFLVAAIGGAALFFSGFMLGRLSGATPGTSDARQELFRPFWNAYDDITTNYVGEIDAHVLVQGAIKGLFEALGDPYSSYMTEEEYRASLSGISGEFEGVGIEMTTVEPDEQPCETISATCRLTITRIIRGSPAVSADLEVDDVVLAVDGTTTIGETLQTAVERVRGPRGTTVTLTIERGGTPREVPVVRDVIQREDVHSEVLGGGRVGYIKVSGFSAASATDLREHLRRLIEERAVDALILDLRDDPGGYVSEAKDIASEFVATGPLYWEQGAGRDPEPQAPVSGGVATDTSIPMAVLVNGGTASASEIVAASLQGNGRALLVGTTTFGKGTIQEFKQLTGAGGYRLSVRKWLTPDQAWIHGVGLIPDVEVAPPADQQPGSDFVRDRAVEVLLDRLESGPAPSGSPAGERSFVLAGFVPLG